jgi:hypothetical protein
MNPNAPPMAKKPVLTMSPMLRFRPSEATHKGALAIEPRNPTGSGERGHRKLPKKMESYWSHGSGSDSLLKNAKPPQLQRFRRIAGAGFEPATFGL